MKNHKILNDENLTNLVLEKFITLKNEDEFLKHINLVFKKDEDLEQEFRQYSTENCLPDISHSISNIPNIKIARLLSQKMTEWFCNNSEFNDTIEGRNAVSFFERLISQVAEGLLLRMKSLVIGSLTGKFTSWFGLDIKADYYVPVSKLSEIDDINKYDLMLISPQIYSLNRVSQYSSLRFYNQTSFLVTQKDNESPKYEYFLDKNLAILIDTNQLFNSDNFYFGLGLITENGFRLVSYTTEENNQIVVWGMMRGLPVLKNTDFYKVVQID